MHALEYIFSKWNPIKSKMMNHSQKYMTVGFFHFRIGIYAMMDSKKKALIYFVSLIGL